MMPQTKAARASLVEVEVAHQCKMKLSSRLIDFGKLHPMQWQTEEEALAFAVYARTLKEQSN